ncbi:hypothetical protein OAK75_06140 [Bacteriovoracales bacterium]|nr:hypothetical protein [Bacteriovoracales bacterium]
MNLIVFCITLFLLSFGKVTFSQVKDIKPTAAASFIKEDGQESFDGLFKKMSKIPALKKKIERCQKYYGEKRGVSVEGIRLSQCVWEGTGEIEGIEDEDKKKYYEKLGLIEKKGKENKGAPYLGIEAVDVKKKEKSTQDQALQALGNFLSEKLKRQFLKGLTEKDSKKDILIDHTSFNKLYKTRISKNIISSISNYCLNATTVGFVQYDPDIEKNQELIKKLKEENLKKLNKFDKDGKKDVNAAFGHWNKCVVQIKNICRQKKVYDPEGTDFKKELKKWYGERDNDQNDHDFEYTSDTACLVNSTIKGLRRILLKVKNIEKDYKNEGKKGIEFKDSGVKVVSAGDVDEMTSLTSKELEDSGFKEKSDEMVKDLKEKCFIQKSTEACKKYVNLKESTKKEDIALLEYKTRLDGLEEKLKNLDDKAVKDYLQKNKYLDEKSVKLINEDDLIEIRKEMKDEFEKEKKALVGRMNKLIKDREVQEKNKGEIDFDLKDTKETFDQIEIGLKTRAKEYTQLLHFNNIVSGFLDITRADDVEETATERVKISNIRTIERELESTAKGITSGPEDGKGAVKDTKKKYLSELKKKLKKYGGKGREKGKEDLEMSAETISDKILQYDTIEERKKEEAEKQ